VTNSPNEEPGQGTPQQATSSEDDTYQEGKRAGAHPFVVILAVILGLWVLLWLYIPGSNTRRATVAPPAPSVDLDDVDVAPVMFQVKATVPALNVITVLVPPQATDSQVIGLLARFRTARLNNELSTLLPATTPGHKLGDNAIAEIYVFSDRTYATEEAVSVLARGAHAPGELYPQAIPFEVSMEHVRGHYRIDLNDTANPDKGSLGFADESGVHSKSYRLLF
jgi:hypothetical protein